MKNIKTMINELSEMGLAHVRDINDFYGSDDRTGLWISGEQEFNGVDVFNSYATFEDPTESMWIMGVQKDLYKYLEKAGYYAEPYDSGTLMIYPE